MSAAVSRRPFQSAEPGSSRRSHPAGSACASKGGSHRRGPPRAAMYGRGPTSSEKGGPSEMLSAAIDIHKSVLQAAVFDPGSGEVADARLPATREALRDWAVPLRGRVAAVAIEATSG